MLSPAEVTEHNGIELMPNVARAAGVVFPSRLQFWWGLSGAIIANELERLMQALYRADKKAGIERNTPERRAAALVAMATRSASAPLSGNKRRPLFTVHVGDGTLADMCELANGMIIRPAQLAGWLDAAMLETILFSGPSTIMSVSHRRSFTGALRRAIEQQQESVGLVDLAAVVTFDHVAGEPVVAAQQFRRALVAQALHQGGGVGEIAQDQGAQYRIGTDCGVDLLQRCVHP